jgi:hypothetical protein
VEGTLTASLYEDDWFSPIASQFPGSCPSSAAAAAFAALAQGATGLEMRMMAFDASFGGDCWVDDAEMQKHLINPATRKPYHRDSFVRCRRRLRERGWVKATRLMPGDELPKKAKWDRTIRGTTRREVCWSVLGTRNPTPRGQRRRFGRLRPQAPCAPGTLLDALNAITAAPRYSASPTTPQQAQRAKTRDELLEKARREKQRLLEWQREQDSGRGGTGPAPVPPGPQHLNTGPPE